MIPILAGGLAAGAGYALANEFLGDEEVDAYKPNKEAFNYDGKEGYYYSDRAAGAQSRDAARADYNLAMQDRAQSNMARTGQIEAANNYRAMLNGNEYSSAWQQLRDSTQQNIAQQMAMARTAGNDANMRRAAVLGGAQAQQQMVGQGALLRAQEYAAATKGLAEVSTAQRAQELQAMGVSAQMAQYQAMLEQQNKQANDAYSLGMYGLGQNADQFKTQSQIAYENMMSGNSMSAAQFNAEQENARRNAALQAGATAFGYGMQYGAGSSSQPKKPGEEP